jgi:hypothetical protein
MEHKLPVLEGFLRKLKTKSKFGINSWGKR